MFCILWIPPGPVICLLLEVSSDYAQPITDQVTEVTYPEIGQAQPEVTPSKRRKIDPDLVSKEYGPFCYHHTAIITTNVQCGAVIARSIFSKILTKDTP